VHVRVSAPLPQWLVWARTLAVLACVAGFAVSGSGKLLDQEVPAIEFAVWGYPRWMLFAVGALELAGAVLLLRPEQRWLGALCLGVVVAGAALTHLRHAEYLALWRPLVFAVLVLIALLPGQPRRKAQDSR
jgi:uncharacterized membrane protein YphA (DoxX/SURF4 family)